MPDKIKPGPGQESVWDYPRPPRIEPADKRIRIEFGGQTIVSTDGAFRVLETSHPPVYYVPRIDVDMDAIVSAGGGSFCEWKGHAHYFDVVTPEKTAKLAAWTYPTPTERFEAIAGFLAFYPSKMDGCFVGDDRVTSQAGDFYGGWITPNIVGPFKGEPGTMGW